MINYCLKCYYIPVSANAPVLVEHATIDKAHINRPIHRVIFSRFSPFPFDFLMILSPDNQGGWGGGAIPF